MRINRLAIVEILRTMVAILVSIVLVFAIVLLLSKTPLTAIRDFLIGPLTSVRRMGNVVEAMIPLIFTGLAVTTIYRAGLYNLSMEGAFFIGSVAAIASALTFDLPAGVNLIVAFACAALAGGLVTFIPGILKVKCDANELVTSLMLNYVCLFVGLYVITNYFYDPTMNATYTFMFPENMALSRIIPKTRIHTGIIVAFASVFIMWLILNKTSFGYKVTLVGKNRTMANYSGMRTGFLIVLSQIFGGMLAGIGGAVDLFGMYKRFQYTGLSGYGWDGILVAIVARKRPEYVPLAALFLAYLRTGADIMSRNSDIPFEIIKIIQAVVIVLISMDVILADYRKKVIVREAKESAMGGE